MAHQEWATIPVARVWHQRHCQLSCMRPGMHSCVRPRMAGGGSGLQAWSPPGGVGKARVNEWATAGPLLLLANATVVRFTSSGDEGAIFTRTPWQGQVIVQAHFGINLSRHRPLTESLPLRRC
jgi:hypothetical protein